MTVYVYSGDGGGKTANSLGLALRSLGHGKTVAIFQFLKWWKNTGEMLFEHPNYKIYQFGREGWHGFDNIDSRDKWLTTQGLMYAYVEMINNKPDLLILDELALAVYLKLIPIEVIKGFIEYCPENTTIVITGRHASKPLLDLADYVIEIVDVKHPKEFESKEGIQY